MLRGQYKAGVVLVHLIKLQTKEVVHLIHVSCLRGMFVITFTSFVKCYVGEKASVLGSLSQQDAREAMRVVFFCTY